MLLHSYFQVSPEMFDRVQVRALAGPLKDIQRLVPKPLLRCLGCVLRDVVLLEGEPSPQSEVKRNQMLFVTYMCLADVIAGVAKCLLGPERAGACFHQGSLCTLPHTSFPQS